MVGKKILLVPLVAVGLGLSGCAQVEQAGKGLAEAVFGPPVDFVATSSRVFNEEGLGSGILQLPNAAVNGLLRVPEGVYHMISSEEPRPLGEYNPLAESGIITGAGWMALGGYVLPLITPAQGALIGGAVGLGVDTYKEPLQ